MATISFWARQDSTTASNASLNPEGDPAELITFTDNGTGDLQIEYNGGLPDPDTQVLIGGIPYNFNVEIVGTLPTAQSDGAQQVPNILEGQQVAVISVIVGGQPREYFFVINNTSGVPITETLMNGFGTGAVALQNVDLTPPPFVCFCSGTDISTPSGSRKVETLRAGDMVLTDTGEAKQVIWVGRSRFSPVALRQNPDLRPIVIPADAMGPGLPATDLHVSPQHRIVLQSAASELLFGTEAVLVPAKFLVGTLAEVAPVTGAVDYFHILLEDHDMLVSNGLPTESFQPARRTIDVMNDAARTTLEGVIAALGAEDMLTRKDRFLSLKRPEAKVLLDLMLRFDPPAERALTADKGLALTH